MNALPQAGLRGKVPNDCGQIALRMNARSPFLAKKCSDDSDGVISANSRIICVRLIYLPQSGKHNVIKTTGALLTKEQLRKWKLVNRSKLSVYAGVFSGDLPLSVEKRGLVTNNSGCFH